MIQNKAINKSKQNQQKIISHQSKYHFYKQIMLPGHFARSSRNTPQRNLNKSEQVTEASTNPSLISNVVPQQSNKGGYVYKPPTRILRSNQNALKQSVAQKVQKVEQKKVQTKTETIQPISSVKPAPFVRRPQNQVPKQVNEVKVSTQSQVKQTKQQSKPTTRTSSRISPSQVNPKPEVQIRQESQTDSNPPPTLNLKKPSPYSYPKKITRRGPQADTQTDRQLLSVSQPQQNLRDTPRFNRKVEQQQQQTAPAKGLQYQAKKPTQSQSASNIKKSQILTNPPVEKIQSQKSITQTTKKSPISHASRYSNIEKKIQTPTKDQNTSQTQLQKPQIKRSPLILYSLHKISSQKYRSFFHQIQAVAKQQTEGKHSQITQKSFQKAISKFCQKYQQGLVRGSFSILKNIFSKLVKSEMVRSLDPKVTNQMIIKRNACFIKVLTSITLSQQTYKKESFSLIRDFSESIRISEKKRNYSAKILGDIQSKRLKQSLAQIKGWSNARSSIKSQYLSRCSDINRNFIKWLKFEALRSIECFKSKQDGQTSIKPLGIRSTKPIIKKQARPSIEQQPQISANKQLRQKVAQLERRIQQAKKPSRPAANQSQLRRSMEQLQQQRQSMQQQLQLKKQRNQQLRQRVDSLMDNKPFTSRSELQSLNDQKIEHQQPTLSLLHQIYMKTYKQSEQECVSEQNIDQLFTIHRVEENQTLRENVAKWIAITHNVNLKHQINLYQGNYISNQPYSPAMASHKQALKKLQEENQIVKKFIRSYIKQRYMWEQVKQYVAAVINQ